MDDATMAKDRLSADVAKVMDDLDALIGAPSTEAEGEAAAPQEPIRDRLRTAKRALSSAQGVALRRARDTDNYAHEHPWQIMGAAAAFGLALGVLVGRR
jgi:ElaB/YqjD/DUF883 family membrane-anchored ribosome-binding protein